MNMTIAICTLLAWHSVWITSMIAAPWLFSDENSFLKVFVDEQFLSFMGVIVTITLASAANLFMEMNKLEERIQKPIFRNAKNGVKQSSYWLITLLIASIVIEFVKSILGEGQQQQSFCNGIAISILIMSTMILIDITQSVFMLDTKQD